MKMLSLLSQPKDFRLTLIPKTYLDILIFVCMESLNVSKNQTFNGYFILWLISKRVYLNQKPNMVIEVLPFYYVWHTLMKMTWFFFICASTWLWGWMIWAGLIFSIGHITEWKPKQRSEDKQIATKTEINNGQCEGSSWSYITIHQPQPCQLFN